MEVWMIVVGDEVMEIGLVRSNVLKKMKSHKKGAPKWLEVSLERLDVTSDSEVLVNYVVDMILMGGEK